MKICKDGRILGQNNKEAGNHLGILTGRQKGIKKGRLKTHWWRTGGEFKKRYIESDKSKAKKSVSHLGELNSQYGKRGELAANWKGGRSELKSLIRASSQYKQWRSDVFQRDYWTCQTCQGRGIYLETHHIISFVDILERNEIVTVEQAIKCKELWDKNNGITLCRDCHQLTNNYGVTRR